MNEPSSNAPVKKKSASYDENLKRFWTGNVRIMLVLLIIWALAGLGCGILFADRLNAFQLGGFPLGFWFAQQGSIIVFVLLILVFCIIMNKRDDEHHKALEELEDETGGES